MATEYTARDLARHVLTAEQAAPFCEEGKARPMTAAAAIVETNLVGYGGHFDEPLDGEEVALSKLAEILAPLYQMSEEEALALLDKVWFAYTRDLTDAMVKVNSAWRAGRYDAIEALQ